MAGMLQFSGAEPRHRLTDFPDGSSYTAGYHLGVLNTCLDFMAADLSFDVTKGGSVVVSAALIGAAVGALAAGQIADKTGPRRALILNNTSLLAGSLLCAFSPGGIWAAVLGYFWLASLLTTTNFHCAAAS